MDKTEMTIRMILNCWVCLNGEKDMKASYGIQYMVVLLSSTHSVTLDWDLLGGGCGEEQIQAFLGEMTNLSEAHFINFWNKAAG